MNLNRLLEPSWAPQGTLCDLPLELFGDRRLMGRVRAGRARLEERPQRDDARLQSARERRRPDGGRGDEGAQRGVLRGRGGELAPVRGERRRDRRARIVYGRVDIHGDVRGFTCVV